MTIVFGSSSQSGLTYQNRIVIVNMFNQNIPVGRFYGWEFNAGKNGFYVIYDSYGVEGKVPLDIIVNKKAILQWLYEDKDAAMRETLCCEIELPKEQGYAQICTLRKIA